MGHKSGLSTQLLLMYLMAFSCKSLLLVSLISTCVLWGTATHRIQEHVPTWCQFCCGRGEFPYPLTLADMNKSFVQVLAPHFFNILFWTAASTHLFVSNTMFISTLTCLYPKVLAVPILWGCGKIPKFFPTPSLAAGRFNAAVRKITPRTVAFTLKVDKIKKIAVTARDFFCSGGFCRFEEAQSSPGAAAAGPEGLEPRLGAAALRAPTGHRGCVTTSHPLQLVWRAHTYPETPPEKGQ